MHQPRSMKLALTVIAALAAGGPASALQSNPTWLSGQEIAQRFKGMTIEGRYATGKTFTERYDDDGRLAYVEAGVTLGGHWSVTQGTLCTIYDYQDTGGCYRVARVASNCYEFFFVSRTEDAAPGPSNGTPLWTARGAIQGRASACNDQPSV